MSFNHFVIACFTIWSHCSAQQGYNYNRPAGSFNGDFGGGGGLNSAANVGDGSNGYPSGGSSPQPSFNEASGYPATSNQGTFGSEGGYGDSAAGFGGGTHDSGQGHANINADGVSGQSFANSHDDSGQYDDGDYSAIPGEPGQDYPIYSEIPETSFSCEQQQYPGFYADVEAQCQVFHRCHDNQTFHFLCPNGTIFHQEYLVCVWWYQFDCSSAEGLYEVNARNYEESLRYSGGGGGGVDGGDGGGQSYDNALQGGVGSEGGYANQGPSEGPNGFGGSTGGGGGGYSNDRPSQPFQESANRPQNNRDYLPPHRK